MKKKTVKSKPYKPVLCLRDMTEGNLFVEALLELSKINIQGNPIREKAMRFYFQDVLAKYLKRLLVSEYPLRLTLKKHEAMLIYDYAHPFSAVSIHFRGFLNEIHQNLIV